MPGRTNRSCSGLKRLERSERALLLDVIRLQFEAPGPHGFETFGIVVGIGAGGTGFLDVENDFREVLARFADLLDLVLPLLLHGRDFFVAGILPANCR